LKVNDLENEGISQLHLNFTLLLSQITIQACSRCWCR